MGFASVDSMKTALYDYRGAVGSVADGQEKTASGAALHCGLDNELWTGWLILLLFKKKVRRTDRVIELNLLFKICN